MTRERQNAAALAAARAALVAHAVLGPLARRVRVNTSAGNACPPDMRAVVTSDGRVFVNSGVVGTSEEWLATLSHLLLHLGLGHLQEREQPTAWRAACDVVVARLAAQLGLSVEEDYLGIEAWRNVREDELYARFSTHGIPETVPASPTGGLVDMIVHSDGEDGARWAHWLGAGLRAGVLQTVRRGALPDRRRERHPTPAQNARSWFITEYPLLGALASAFTLVEDADVCKRAGIAIAAVSPGLREVYINPGAGLDTNESRFVVAHELLHVGLLHHRRRSTRNPFLWNIACDYVINGWLVEMGVGVIPAFGGHRDLRLRGLSAEAVYDRIQDRFDVLSTCGTFRGIGMGDIVYDDEPEIQLDAFLRRCLTTGMETHHRHGRGTLPAGLIEDIRGRIQAAIPWDVRLARWLDERVAPTATRRSYARASRRQSSTPNIPRPGAMPRPDETRTFGVILDTSASMRREVLSKALGSIAAFALSREVTALRLVYCDASPYDEGYLAPDELLDWVDVRGRGGTVLQPAVDLLDRATDFPPSCPILVITDGECDTLEIEREHAFLIPDACCLPVDTTAPVFEMSG